ncbi:MAG: hypothetical protein ABIS59_01430 [Candidatus Saccharibacteria bacterium]
MTVTDPAVRTDGVQTICPAGSHELASMLGLDDDQRRIRIMGLAPTHRSALCMAGGIVMSRERSMGVPSIELLPHLDSLIIDAHARLATS